MNHNARFHMTSASQAYLIIRIIYVFLCYLVESASTFPLLSQHPHFSLAGQTEVAENGRALMQVPRYMARACANSFAWHSFQQMPADSSSLIFAHVCFTCLLPGSPVRYSAAARRYLRPWNEYEPRTCLEEPNYFCCQSLTALWHKTASSTPTFSTFSTFQSVQTLSLA